MALIAHVLSLLGNSSFNILELDIAAKPPPDIDELEDVEHGYHESESHESNEVAWKRHLEDGQVEDDLQLSDHDRHVPTLSHPEEHEQDRHDKH